MNVLIADDDTDLATLIGRSTRLLWPGSTATIVADGVAALRAYARERPDYAILDIGMPLADGLTVCRELRQRDRQLPILMLTGRDTVLDEVRALEAGADHYLIKPFDHTRLLARLRALERRTVALNEGTIKAKAAQREVVLGDVAIDFAQRQVRVGERPVALTPPEYILLETLARAAGQFIPHRTLLERTWGSAYANQTHYLKVFVNRLRRKLDDDAAYPRYIQTRRGLGYCFGPAH